MKKLVLGALIAAASATGCSSSTSSGDNVVTARWSFTHLASNSAGSCPHASDSAVIMSEPWDPETQAQTGPVLTDIFNCTDGRGTAALPDDTYLVWVEIQDAGGHVFAKSDQSFVDSSLGDTTIDMGFFDDGGYFFFSWDLIDKATNQRVSCRTAGITANGRVEVISTSIANSSYFKDDKFTCEDHFGTTDPLLVGHYVVSVNAEENDAIVGDPINVPDEVIVANSVRDLGDFKIKVPVH
jgi:hypothetical protein